MMKIAEIRRVIDACNWNRNDLGGATQNEFKAMKVSARLQPHIDAVRDLVIPDRFQRDKEAAARAIELAEATIERWRNMQGMVPPKPSNAAGPAIEQTPRPTRGRPAMLVGGMAKKVYLDQDSLAIALRFGEGKVSERIRQGLRLLAEAESGRAGAEQA
jgi:hypothetical protein